MLSYLLVLLKLIKLLRILEVSIAMALGPQCGEMGYLRFTVIHHMLKQSHYIIKTLKHLLNLL